MDFSPLSAGIKGLELVVNSNATNHLPQWCFCLGLRLLCSHRCLTEVICLETHSDLDASKGFWLFGPLPCLAAYFLFIALGGLRVTLQTEITLSSHSPSSGWHLSRNAYIWVENAPMTIIFYKPFVLKTSASLQCYCEILLWMFDACNSSFQIAPMCGVCI